MLELFLVWKNNNYNKKTKRCLRTEKINIRTHLELATFSSDAAQLTVTIHVLVKEFSFSLGETKNHIYVHNISYYKINNWKQC